MIAETFQGLKLQHYLMISVMLSTAQLKPSLMLEEPSRNKFDLSSFVENFPLQQTLTDSIICDGSLKTWLQQQCNMHCGIEIEVHVTFVTS